MKAMVCPEIFSKGPISHSFKLTKRPKRPPLVEGYRECPVTHYPSQSFGQDTLGINLHSRLGLRACSQMQKHQKGEKKPRKPNKPLVGGHHKCLTSLCPSCVQRFICEILAPDDARLVRGHHKYLTSVPHIIWLPISEASSSESFTSKSFRKACRLAIILGRR